MGRLLYLYLKFVVNVDYLYNENDHLRKATLDLQATIALRSQMVLGTTWWYPSSHLVTLRDEMLSSQPSSFLG